LIKIKIVAKVYLFQYKILKRNFFSKGFLGYNNKEYFINFISKLLIQKKYYFCRPNKIPEKMKKEIHPKEYRAVVFKDMSNEYAFLSKSTVNTKDSIVWEDGKEYPLVKLEISNTSHPFFTGKMKLVDTAGRVDKFRSKYAKLLDKKN